MKIETSQQIFDVIETICDLVLVNLLWIIFCIPVITIGPATAAMHYVVRKIVVGDGYKVFKSFMHSFSQNLKQGIPVGLLTVGLTFLCFVDFYVAIHLTGWMSIACWAIGLLTALIALDLWVVAFALLARYQMAFSQLMKDTFLLAMAHPLIIVANIGLLAILPVLCLIFNPFITYVIPVALVTIGAIPGYVTERMLRRPLAKLEQSGKDDDNLQS